MKARSTSLRIARAASAALAFLGAAAAPASAQNRPPLPTRTNALHYGVPMDAPCRVRIETQNPSLAGAPAYLLFAFNQTPSNIWGYDVGLTVDSLTNLQFTAGMNGAVGGFVFQSAGALDAAGAATMSVTIPSYVGVPIGAPLFLNPVVVASGATPTVAATATILGPAVPTAPGPGGQWVGPGDSVPGSPPSTGTTSGPCTGNMTETTDPLFDPLAVTVNVDTKYQGPIQFGCVQNVGEVGELTLSELFQKLPPNWAAMNIKHLDLVWNSPSTPPLRDLRIYPVLALQQAGVDWLALHPTKFDAMGARVPIQVCNPLCSTDVHGTPQPPVIDEFGLPRGFYFPACEPNLWNRAHGQGRACVRDDCACGETLTGVRLRVRFDCLLQRIAAIETANPGFFTNSTVLFAFAGEWCDQ